MDPIDQVEQHDRQDRHLPRWAATALFAALYLLVAYVGRRTVVENGLSLVWPAAGIGVLWLGALRSRLIGIDMVALLAVSFLVNVATGAPTWLAGVLMLSNGAQSGLTVVLLRRWVPHLWGAGGRAPLRTNAEFGSFMITAAVGAALGMVVGSLGVALTGGHVDGIAVAMWWGRNLCGILTIASFGMLLGAHIVAGESFGRRLLQGRGLETAALVVVGLVIYGLAFTVLEHPLAFPLLATTVWAGLRIHTLLVSLHSLVIGVVTAAFTVAGKGPFAPMNDNPTGALLAQAFVAMVVITGLAIALGRDERTALTRELRASEAESARQAGLMSAVVELVDEGITVLTDKGEMVVANGAALRILGADGALEGDEPWRLTVHHLDGRPMPLEARPSSRALSGESVRATDVLYRAADGVERIVEVSGQPLDLDDDDDVRRAVMVFRDVTDARASSEDLKNFASVVAHDLGNPLMVISAWTEELGQVLVEDQPDAELARGMVARVEVGAHRMRQLIADLLDHATSGERVLEVKPIDVVGMLEDVIAGGGHEGLVHVADIPIVEADALLLRQVLANLVTNAVKYVAPGVVPDVRVTGRRADHMVELRVADNGIGIPPEDRERVFRQFVRLAPGDYQGTGLGLAIVRRSIERHGGTIRVEGNPSGHGSCFVFTLPAAD